MTSDNCCKLSRATADYGISEHVLADSIDDLLANKWLGEGSQPNTALRPLTDWFNRKLLSAVYTKHDRKTLEPQIEADYDALVGDDEGRRQLVVDDLEQDGIDAGTVVDDLISTSSLYRHLTQCLDVGKETQRGSSDTGWEADKIRYAKRMARDRAEDVLRSWENKGKLPEATAATVSVDISVECPVCSKRSPILQSHNRGYICEDHMTADE